MIHPQLPVRSAESNTLEEHKRVTADLNRYLALLQQRLEKIETMFAKPSQPRKPGW